MYWDESYPGIVAHTGPLSILLCYMPQWGICWAPLLQGEVEHPSLQIPCRISVSLDATSTKSSPYASAISPTHEVTELLAFLRVENVSMWISIACDPAKHNRTEPARKDGTFLSPFIPS